MIFGLSLDYIGKVVFLEKKAWFIIFFFLVSLFVGLRYNTGADFYGYKTYFNHVLDKQINAYEPGYKYLNILFKYIFNNYFSVQCFSTILLLFSLYKFYKSKCKYFFTCIFLAITLSFYSLFMSQVRQSLAIAIILLGSKFIYEKKIIKYFLIVILASMFHITALFCFMLYFLNIKLNKYFRIFLYLASIYFIFNTNLIRNFLVLLSNFFPGGIGTLIRGYVNSSIFNKSTKFGSGLFFYGNFLLGGIVLIFYTPKTAFEHFIHNCLLLYGIFNNLSIGFNAVSRLSLYFIYFMPIAYTSLLDTPSFSRSIKKLILCMYIFVYSFAFYKPILNNDSFTSLFLPYYNCISYPNEAITRKDWIQF